MCYSKKELIESNKTLIYILHQIKRIKKIQFKLHKLNRSCYGVNRNIENLIHLSETKLTESFLWLDKSYFQLKKNISEKEKHNNFLISKGYKINE